ncbi:MAG TPA: GNAT family N-acetyltransferase [Candidatus Binataceae bacterium]
MSSDLSQYFADRILHDGTPMRIRAIRSDDKQLLARHFDGLGSDSRYNRFFGIKNGLTAHELRYFTEPDFFRHVALVATRAGGEVVPDLIVSDGRYVALEEGRSVAELGLSVIDAWQRRGIGGLMLECLTGIARYQHVSRLEASVLASNRGVMRFLQRRGFRSAGTSGGVTRMGLSVENDDGGSALESKPFDVPPDFSPASHAAPEVMRDADTNRQRRIYLRDRRWMGDVACHGD